MFRTVALFENHGLAYLLVASLRQAGFHPAPLPEAPSVIPHQHGLAVEVPAGELDAVREFLKSTPFQQHLHDR
jgi:hypothetical protein